MMTVDYRTGQVLDQIRQLPDASVDLVTTSPPFLALRDYGGHEGQWGSEPDPASFLDHLLELTAELRRVLAPHGSIAIELGDTYSGSTGGGGDYQLREVEGRKTRRESFVADGVMPNTIRRFGDAWPAPKSLCGTPTLFAWSLAYGRNLLRPDHTIDPWLVRNVIVWARNNPPVGALGDKVRPATSYITVACPSPRRWFDLDAVRTAYAYPNQVRRPLSEFKDGKNRDSNRGAERGGLGEFRAADGAGAPPLDHWHDEPDGDLLWLINTQGSSLAHYAMWPPKLVERLILSMCPAQVCRAVVCAKCDRPIEGITSDTRRDFEMGRAEDRLPDAIQAELRRVRYLLRKPKPVDVRPVVRSDQGSAEPTQGPLPDALDRDAGADTAPGVHPPPCSGPSASGQGLRAGAPAGDGATPGPAAGAVGERPPQERDQARQPARESGGGAEQRPSWGGDLSALWDRVLRHLTCDCGHVGARTCGEPRRRLVESTRIRLYGPDSHKAAYGSLAGRAEPWTSEGHTVRETIGWSDCGHGDNWRPGHVLDTFAGTGTTLAVADILGRDATGVDLDPANPGLYPARYAQCWAALRPDAGASPVTEAGEQLGLAI